MITFNDVQKTYRNGIHQVIALRDINLQVHRGEVFGVIGRSGAGKSSLIRLINGLEKPSSGSILVDGQVVNRLDDTPLIALRRRIGMIFQHFNLLKSQTVFENVAFPLRLAGIPKEQIQARVGELLARVGLEQHASAHPAQLSGGQKQRVGIARALATGPTILLCDEATSALDPQTTASVLDLLAELNKELGLTIVLITHEMEVVRRVCDRVAVLEAGQVVESGRVQDVFLHPQHPTTRTFLEDADMSADSAARSLSGARERLIRVTLVGDQVHSAVLSRVLRELEADYFIASGRVDKLKALPYGQVTLAVAEDLCEVVIQRLTSEGVLAQAVVS